MGEDGEPLFRDGVCVVAFAALDGVEREDVIGHHPGEVEMMRGRDKVRDVAGSLAAALYEDGLHVFGVPGIKRDRDAGNDICIAGKELHLA